MKHFILITAALAFTLTACASAPQTSSADNEIRAAQPGVVDHNVIPKKSRSKK